MVLTLGNLLVLMVLAAAGAWLWHAHGIRERALELVKQHCAKVHVELLDGNVALRKLTWMRDAQGQRRLARVYGFEFTVTGEQRHVGSISLFGKHLGHIELAPHPIPAAAAPAPAPLAQANYLPANLPTTSATASVSASAPRTIDSSNVVQLEQYLRDRK